MTDPLQPFSHSDGPTTGVKTLFVAEAWGRNEAELKTPLVGASGQEFFRLLGEAWPEASPVLMRQACASMTLDADKMHIWVSMRKDWLDAERVCLTNVFNLRPPENKLDALCATKKALGPAAARYPFAPISKGKYLLPEYFPHVQRLHAEIAACRPNLIVALGATALWALMGTTAISSHRGACAMGAGGRKILPTFHPANILRDWSRRPVLLVDLMKAGRERQFPELIRPERQVLIFPTLEQIAEWFSRPATMYAVDVETGRGQIKCIGFARSRSDAIVIPFVDMGVEGGSYWPEAAEILVWQYVKAALEGPIRKLFQNGMYDLQYIARMGIKVNNCTDDTMLLHHSLHPEMPKSLGFMGSIYCNEASWKLMRHEKADTEKKDE